MNPIRPERLLTPSDLLLILVVLFISVVSFLAIRSGDEEGDLVIIEYSSGRLRESIKWPKRFEFKGPVGKSIVEIKDGKVRMVDSACRDKVCIHTGWISKKGKSIVCLPNHILIRIEGKSKEGYDAISR